MCELSNIGRPDSEGKTSWEDGNIAETFTGQDFYKKLISQAASVNLIGVIKNYNIKVPPGINKIICPFKSHKGGKERTPSFQIFAHTNSFYCHGCSFGGSCVSFVAKMDGLTKIDAAQKILSLFESNFDESAFPDVNDLDLKLELMMKFSEVIRNFRQSHFDEKSEIFIEKISETYDFMCSKHKLYNDNASLKSTIDKFIYVIDAYSPLYKI